MGLSTPKMGGLKDAFFDQKNPKNGHVSAHPIHPEIDPDFWTLNDPKIMDGTLRENPGPMAKLSANLIIVIHTSFFTFVFVWGMIFLLWA